jgi:menaquinone C8-methyltransferase
MSWVMVPPMMYGLFDFVLRQITRRTLTLSGEAPRLPEPVPGREYLLYLHVPFCESLCPFCSFHRVQYDGKTAQSYFEALRREIMWYHERGFRFNEVYVGGGTPTVNIAELVSTLNLVRDLLGVAQISVETNPNHLQDGTLQQLKAAGVRRLSVGVQSFNDDLLQRMNRYAAYGSGEDIRDRLAAAQDVFDTLNTDFIFNLPGQTREMLHDDLSMIKSLGIDQVSYYPLMTSAPVASNIAMAMGPQANNEHPYYKEIVDFFSDGYHSSSAWCFSRRESMIDEYIVNHEEYVGAGSGAFSYLNGALYATTFSIEQYPALVSSLGNAVTHQANFSRHDQLRYHFMTKLFGLSLDINQARAQWGAGYARELAGEITALRLLGALRKTPTGYSLTGRGRYYWVMMMREFLTGVNNIRDRMRVQSGIDQVRLSGF